MQWSPDRNAGFSRANPQELYLPTIMDPVYGFETVNVEAQTRSSSSLLNWMKRLIAVRRAHKTFGRGSLEFIYPGNRKIFAYIRAHAGEVILCVVNLSRHAQPVELDLAAYAGRVPVELLGRTPFPPIGELPYLLTLPAYGFYWFLLAEEAEVPSWHQTIPEPLPDFVTVVMRDGWSALDDPTNRRSLERQALVPFARNQRWFAAKDAAVSHIEMGPHAAIREGSEGVCLQTLEVELADGAAHRYVLPLAVAWGEENVHTGSTLLPFTLAKARRGSRIGALHDATAGEHFAHVLLADMRAEKRIDVAHGTLLFRAGSGLAELGPFEDPSVKRLGVEQSNTSMMIGRDVIVKLYRRLQPGVHPEVEVGRFLTEVGGFANTPPLLGSLEWLDEAGEPTAIAAAFAFVLNQGDGWSYSIGFLERELEPLVLAAAASEDEMSEVNEATVFALYNDFARRLGTRTADLHRAFAVDTDDPAFAAEPITAADLAAWADGVERQAEAAFRAIGHVYADLDDATAALAEAVLDRREGLKARLAAVRGLTASAAKTRLHGDYHLGQVLVSKDDVHLLDFEGEPARPLAERRAKMAVHKDVAGMLRSFDYVAETVGERLVGDRGHADATVRALMERWRAATTAAFLDAYRSRMEGCRSLPQDAEEDRLLLDLFLLEKAFYEIGYEAANRPAWLAIPLKGVTALLPPADDTTH
jgi:maltose alpha-D-glucosyltransferase/alpha-amylase